MQTDNSSLDIKVKLRMDHMPPGDIRVLDAFGGKGVIWKEVKNRSSQVITRDAIDKKGECGAICGDNRKWLRSLSLSKYDVIDLDAYGFPFEQLEIIFSKRYEGQYSLPLFRHCKASAYLKSLYCLMA